MRRGKVLFQARASVTPGARHDRITKTGEHRFTVRVKEDPRGGNATMRVRELIAGVYQVPLHTVVLVRGARSRVKMFSIYE